MSRLHETILLHNTLRFSTLCLFIDSWSNYLPLLTAPEGCSPIFCVVVRYDTEVAMVTVCISKVWISSSFFSPPLCCGTLCSNETADDKMRTHCRFIHFYTFLASLQTPCPTGLRVWASVCVCVCTAMAAHLLIDPASWSRRQNARVSKPEGLWSGMSICKLLSGAAGNWREALACFSLLLWGSRSAGCCTVGKRPERLGYIWVVGSVVELNLACYHKNKKIFLTICLILLHTCSCFWRWWWFD